MSREFYILNHPERDFAKEECTFLEKQGIDWTKKTGQVVIPVDHINSESNNQDPYVFHNPWLYGYCKNALLPYKMAGDGSGIFFGKYHRLSNKNQKYSFLLDTIFISERKFNWKDEFGNIPSMNFTRAYPSICSGKHYRNFIAPRKTRGEHPKAKSIFVAKHLEVKNSMIQIEIKSNKDYFSCIPLYRDGNGVFNLIDILPIIEKSKPDMFENFEFDKKKLYKIDIKLLNGVYKYVLDNANILVIKTSGQAALDKADRRLNEIYLENIYGTESKEKYFKNKKKQICYSKKEEDKNYRC
jgi:hypothetical protein